MPQVKIVNPRCMCEGYGSRHVSVCVCVCVPVTTLAAAMYVVHEFQVMYYMVPYGVSIVCAENASFSSFVFSRCLHNEFLMHRMNTETVMASFQEDWCVGLVIAPVTRVAHH